MTILPAAMLRPLVLLTALLAAGQSLAADPLCFRGVNLSGGEYGEKGGIYGTNYIYPSEKTVHYFAAKGMNAVRLPIKWERLQPVLFERLDGRELDRLNETVRMIRKAGMTVILDPHNFGQYEKKTIATETVPKPALADFWTRLAAEYSGDSGVVFGLMNEPYDIKAPDWLEAANLAIAAIRNVKAENLILVPGTIWSGAYTWSKDIPGGSNATVMQGVKDPLDHYAFEFHQYQDGDMSGTHDTCERAGDAVQGLEQVSEWLRQHGKRGLLGEFGGSKDKACLAGLKAMTGTLAKDSDVWIGWTYWAAGEWWPETEALNIQPRSEKTPPQLAALKEALKGPADPDRCLAR